MNTAANVIPLYGDEPRKPPGTRRRRRTKSTVGAVPLLVLIHSDPKERRPRNGHTPDCPYPTTDPKACGICASERKGRP